MVPISFAARRMAARSNYIMYARLSGRMGDQGGKLAGVTNFVFFIILQQRFLLLLQNL